MENVNNFNRIEELRKAVDEITSDDYCAKAMDTVDSIVGDALEMVIHHAERYIEISEVIQKKMNEIKKSDDYSMELKDQMTVIYEYILSLFN